MFYKELQQYLRLVDEIGENDILVIPKGAAAGIDYNVVASRADFECILVKYRATDPISEAILSTLAKPHAPKDRIWTLLSSVQEFKDTYKDLSSELIKNQLEAIRASEEYNNAEESSFDFIGNSTDSSNIQIPCSHPDVNAFQCASDNPQITGKDTSDNPQTRGEDASDNNHVMHSDNIDSGVDASPLTESSEGEDDSVESSDCPDGADSFFRTLSPTLIGESLAEESSMDKLNEGDFESLEDLRAAMGVDTDSNSTLDSPSDFGDNTFNPYKKSEEDAPKPTSDSIPQPEDTQSTTEEHEIDAPSKPDFDMKSEEKSSALEEFGLAASMQEAPFQEEREEESLRQEPVGNANSDAAIETSGDSSSVTEEVGPTVEDLTAFYVRVIKDFLEVCNTYGIQNVLKQKQGAIRSIGADIAQNIPELAEVLMRTDNIADNIGNLKYLLTFVEKECIKAASERNEGKIEAILKPICTIIYEG